MNDVITRIKLINFIDVIQLMKNKLFINAFIEGSN
jgi:hypothetical protein